MKTKLLILLTILLLGTSSLKAQYVDIPDPAFRTFLQSDFPECYSNGKLDTTCIYLNDIETLRLPGNIVSLQGVQYFRDLVTLDYSYYAFSELPALPPRLVELFLIFTNLSVLPALPQTLETLICDENQLSVLPELPHSLLELGCGSNLLIQLPQLPPNLQSLNCYNNQIIILPDLPESLLELNCEFNSLTELPVLPNSLNNLFCNNNKLISLPVLPASLTQLECGFNMLLNLPPLPDSISFLDCTNNKLTSLPTLPKGLQYLYCSSNNLLSCLPFLPPNISELYTYETDITCIPNLPENIYYEPAEIPVCTDLSEICNVSAYARGKIFLDMDGNGIYASETDIVLPHELITVLPSNWVGISDAEGNYWISLDPQINNSWSINSLSPYLTPTPLTYELTPVDSSVQTGSFDFALAVTPNEYDLSVSIGGGPFRPGFQANLHITVENAGTVGQNGITVKMKRPEGYDVLSAVPAYSYISNGTIFWTDVAIDLFKSKVFSVQLQVPVSAELGSEVVFEVWVTGQGGETNPKDNHTVWTDTVQGSFDPNDKLVNSNVLSHLYSNTDRLLYTIRFQNTGTDTAFTVIVRDEIPDNLDVSSLRVVNASHSYQLIVREKNIVEVAFPNIQLPDSNRNEPGSHGFVQLSLKPIAGLPVDEEIKNSAAIFFDYNAPVITNDAVTIVSILSGVASNRKLNFKVFPNPASQLLRIELPYSDEGKWLLSDISGRVLQENSFPPVSRQLEIPVSSFPSGTYFLTLQMGGERSTAKVVVLR